MLSGNIKSVVVFAIACIAMWAPRATAADTLKNLQEAYNGESNARAKYLSFAEQADKEGYGQVASLFRAAARAEEVHAGNHAAVIKKLGAEPVKEIKPAEVKSTRENLEAAIKGEDYERDTMYPGFIKQARLEGNKDALETFTLAKTAEAEHSKLYAEALKNLDAWKGGKKDFFVCSKCGYTVEKLPAGKCPSCFVSSDRYEKVN